jgi:hypothetical protein
MTLMSLTCSSNWNATPRWRRPTPALARLSPLLYTATHPRQSYWHRCALVVHWRAHFSIANLCVGSGTRGLVFLQVGVPDISTKNAKIAPTQDNTGTKTNTCPRAAIGQSAGAGNLIRARQANWHNCDSHVTLSRSFFPKVQGLAWPRRSDELNHQT